MIIAASSGGNGLSLLLPLVLLAGLYLLFVRPQRARMRQMQTVQRSLEPGTRVITTAGLHATVMGVDGDIVLLEIAPGVVSRFAAQSVVRTLPTDEHDTGGDSEPDTVADPEASATLAPSVDDVRGGDVPRHDVPGNDVPDHDGPATEGSGSTGSDPR